MKKKFKGKYYKHQKDGKILSFIVGQAEDGDFIQVISNEKVWQYSGTNGFYADKYGIRVNLPDIKGSVRYHETTPLKYDIMGPFRLLPMQCRHYVFSMRHELSGEFEIEGIKQDFNGGLGYIEGDSGYSFPREYLWLHFNDSNSKCSIMASVADIPFAGFRFMGCICAVFYEGTEYRFATYNGVKICYAGRNGLELRQGGYRLKINISEQEKQPLKSPSKGKMTGIIYESNQTFGRFRLWKTETLLFDIKRGKISFECNLTKPQRMILPKVLKENLQ